MAEAPLTEIDLTQPTETPVSLMSIPSPSGHTDRAIGWIEGR
jgi:hypothetical protein